MKYRIQYIGHGIFLFFAELINLRPTDVTAYEQNVEAFSGG